jgi:hypothetical protein
VRGRVVLADGTAASGAVVWSSRARALADSDGTFALSAACAGEPCFATSPGFQPAETQPSSDGFTLQLGPPTLAITGRIRAQDGLESQGRRVAVLDATWIEPVGLEAVTQESASSRAPARLQSSVDGSFAIDGLSARPYTLAAWRAARDRVDLFATSPVEPGRDPVEIPIPPADARRTIELRCLDSRGTPLPNVRVSLPGAPPIAATNQAGKIVLAGVLPAQITLALPKGDGSVQLRVVDLSAHADIVLDGN